MRKYKLILGMLLSATILFSENVIEKNNTCMVYKDIAIAAEAENIKTGEFSYDKKVETILKTGVPEEIAESYSAKRVDSLYTWMNGRHFTYAGSETLYFNNTENGLEISPYSTIHESDLKLTIDFYEELSEYNEYLDYEYGYVSSVIVNYGFSWLTIPFYQLVDAFTLNWDANLFEPAESNYFYAVSEYAVSDLWTEIEYITKPSTLQSGGIGWMLSINTREPSTLPASLIPSGGAGVFLNAKRDFYSARYADINADTTAHTDFYVGYAHQKLGATISFGVSPTSTSLGPTVGVTFSGGNYDLMADFGRYYFQYDE